MGWDQSTGSIESIRRRHRAGISPDWGFCGVPLLSAGLLYTNSPMANSRHVPAQTISFKFNALDLARELLKKLA